MAIQTQESIFKELFPFFEYTNLNFMEYFVSEENISVATPVVKFKEIIAFFTYNPKNPTT